MNKQEEPNWKKRLYKKTNQPQKEIQKQIQQKKENWDGLLTEESATILVARKHNIQLTQQNQSQELKIQNIVPEMRNVSLTAHIKKIQSEHNPSDQNYRVTSVIIEDNTGEAQLSFWNEHSDQAQKLRSGLKIRIQNAYTQKEEKISDYVKKNFDAPGIQINEETKITVYNNKGDQKQLL